MINSVHDRYLEQFKEIFTEEGRRAVKITTQKPGQAPHVEFTQTSQTPTGPPQGLLSAHAPALTAAIKGQFTQVRDCWPCATHYYPVNKNVCYFELWIKK